MSKAKPKLAVYWASACGGCEIAFANLGEKLLELTEHLDFVFCPCLLDAKRADVEALADGELAVTLFDGAIRTSENEEWAHLLRRKSRLLVAMGACAHGGGVPALSNLSTRAAHFEQIYLTGTDNPQGHVPSARTVVPEGVLTLPVFSERVSRLSDVVPVDYAIPGCPPEEHQLWNVLLLFMGRGGELPPPGSILGAGEASVCDRAAALPTGGRSPTIQRGGSTVAVNASFLPSGDHSTDAIASKPGVAPLGASTRTRPPPIGTTHRVVGACSSSGSERRNATCRPSGVT